MDISAFKGVNVAKEVVATKEESKEMKAIKRKYEQMDVAYFKKIVDNLVFYGRQFESNRTAENQYLLELAKIELWKAEARYYGYKEILEDPDKLEEVKQRVKEKLDDLELTRKSLIEAMKYLQKKKEGEQLKLGE
jgi:hypothetical protein